MSIPLAVKAGVLYFAVVFTIAFALVCDFTMVLQARGLTLQMYFDTLDPVSGTAYYVLLGIFGITPYLFGGRA